MSRVEELEALGFQDLRAEAKELGLSGAGSKEELVERIVRFEATGVTEEDAAGADEDETALQTFEAPAEDGEAAVTDADDNDTPSEEAAPAVEEADEAPESTVETVEVEEDRFLIKYTGKSSFFERGPYRFSVKHPFVAVDKDRAEELVAKEPKRFRTATPKEIESFYS